MKELLASADTYGSTLVELGKANPDIFAVDADLMKASGSRIFRDTFPDRHINVGVAEQNLVSLAAGIASMGRIAFASTMANFISQRACDQVVISGAYNKFNVKLVGSFAGLSQEKNGGTHIGLMDIAIMRCLPNMTVFVASDQRELKDIIIASTKIDGPVYIRMSRFLPGDLFGNNYNFKPGKALIIGQGEDITLVSTGISSMVALESLDELKKQNISCRMVHLPSIKPVDKELILKCARETKAIITIEDHSIYGGLGGLISEITSLEHPVKIARIGMEDKFGLTASLEYQLDYFGISTGNILNKAMMLLGK
ncbi:MAG: transketolase family protein [Actinobacteria bacterium]|nr:transketolase family protein [Actinomycetota bacterium]